MDIGDDLVMDRHGFDLLLDVLRRRGLRTIGPVVRDGAIMHGEVSSTADLPEGWHDHTSPGNYRLTNDDGPELFGWAVGPESWKSEFFLPTETVWRGTRGKGEGTLSHRKDKTRPAANVGGRAFEHCARG